MFDELKRIVDGVLGEETEEEARKRFQGQSPLTREELARLWALRKLNVSDIPRIKEILLEIAGRASEKEREKIEKDLVSSADHIEENAKALRSFEGANIEDEARRRELAALDIREWACVIRMRKVQEAWEWDAKRVSEMVREMKSGRPRRKSSDGPRRAKCIRRRADR